MAKLPKLKTDAEVAEFWDTHDLTDYLEDFEEVTDAKFVRPPKGVIALRLDEPIVRAIKTLARRKGLGYSPLIRMWLIERLEQEIGHRKAS